MKMKSDARSKVDGFGTAVLSRKSGYAAVVCV